MYGSGLQPLRSALRASRARAVVWLVLAAFVLQFTATRAHFHFNAADVGVAGASADSKTPAKVPLHDQANCPLFHAASVCGAALAGAATTLAILDTGTTRTAFAPAAAQAERIAANWRSRAPPSV
jgi:hypothetical protein